MCVCCLQACGIPYVAAYFLDVSSDESSVGKCEMKTNTTVLNHGVRAHRNPYLNTNQLTSIAAGTFVDLPLLQ